MQKQKLSALSVIKDTFSSVGDVYLGNLWIFSPSLVLTLIAGSSQMAIGLLVTYLNLLIGLILGGVAIFYTYHNWSGNRVSISYSFQRCLPKIPNLILAWILFTLIIVPGFILLIIPGLYLTVRLSFFSYPVIIEDCSGIEAISRSWELTKGHWWFIFRTNLLISGIILIPAIAINLATILIEVYWFGDFLIWGITPLVVLCYVIAYSRLK